MRGSINRGVASAKSRGAKFIMKTDGHCSFSDGFDEVLKKDIDKDWVVVPRRGRLDPENWIATDTNKPDIDYHYLSFPDDPKDFGGPGLNGKVWEQRARERKDILIDEEMSSQGSCWFMHTDYFYQLELMDAGSYGPFWNEMQEIGLKCWLSGGQLMVNKNAKYLHLHKGSKYGRGYRLEESALKQGRDHTMKWLFNEAWPKQTLPFNTLIERFWPVPTWPENWEELVYGSKGSGLVVGVGNRDVSEHVLGNTVDVVTGLTIHTAHYGISDTDFLDVTPRIQSLVKDNCLDIGISNAVIVPGENPWRGQKKQLKVIYSYAGGEPITVVRDERDALIIGQMKGAGLTVPIPKGAPIFEVARKQAEDEILGRRRLSATALNDLLIRRFNIPDRRLRGPMPIEIPTFHRDDLAKLFAELSFNKGAEIGVAEGKYSEILVKANPNLELLCVDPWHAYSSNPQNKSEQKHEFAYAETKRRLKGYNVKLDMRYSMDAVRDIPEESLDFCYIDAHHGFDFCMSDLIEWSKRVRSGGIISGDDYFYINAFRWGAGVVEAVQAYTSAHKINPWFICNADRSTDYFWVKP